jgi:tetratricopeptide (TPR) repeat protein
MRGKIFVNYRRDDNAERALAIASYLKGEFGSRRVFIDIDNLRAGQSFPEELEKRLSVCDVMLTLIGPLWLEMRDGAGARRLDDPQDWVRLEIERALARKIVVIPVLTGGASLPKAADLPDSLKPLIKRQTAVVATNTFRSDMAGLVRDMREIMGGQRWGLIAAAAGALALASIGVVVIVQPKTTLPLTQEAAMEGEVQGARKTNEEAARKAAQAEEEKKRIQTAELKAAQEASEKTREAERKTAQEAAEKKRAQDEQRLAIQEAAEKDKAAEDERKAARKRLSAEVARLIASGEAFLKDHNNDQAIAAYTQAISLDPQNARAYALRSWAYDGNHNKTNSGEDAREAVILDPSVALGHVMLASAYLDTGEPDRALGEANRAINLDARLAVAYSERGLVYDAKKDYDQAIVDSTKAIEIDPKLAVAYNNRGSAYYHKQDYDRAIADYTKAIEIDPKDPDAYYNRSLAYKAKGNSSRAAADYKMAKELGYKE